MKRLFILLLIAFCTIAPIHVIAQTKTNTTVATARGESISSDTFVDRFKYERFLRVTQLKQIADVYLQYGYTSDQIEQQLKTQPPYGDWLRELTIPDLMGVTIINTLVDEVLIKQEAHRLKLVVNQTDIDHVEQLYFGVSNGLENLSEAEKTTYEATVNQYFIDLNRETGLKESDIRPYFEATALRTALRDEVTKDLSSKPLYAHVRHILVGDETTAKSILKQLADGQSFESLAKKYSLDSYSGENGGELDWTLVDNYQKEFAAAIRNAVVGETVGPIKTELGYEIIYIIGRENRVGNEVDVLTAKETAFNNWLTTLRSSAKPEINIQPIWIDYVPSFPVYTFPSNGTQVPPTTSPTPLPPSTPESVDLNSINFDETYMHPSKKFSAAVPSGWLVGYEINEPDRLDITFNNGPAFSVIQITAESNLDITTLADISDYYSPVLFQYLWSNYANYNEIERHHDSDKLIINFDLISSQTQFYKSRQISWLDNGWLVSIRIVVPASETRLLNFLEENMVTKFKLSAN